MISTLDKLDKQLFLLLNDLHTSWMDPVMFYASKTEVWIPFYLLLLYFILKESGKETWIILLGVAVTIVLADRITSGLMKPWFERLRPSWSPDLAGLVYHVNDYRGGKFGFPSSHAANTFGTAVFFVLTHSLRRWIYVLFAWALFVSFSRIYLGVHYPGDILAGGLIGSACGWLASRLVFSLKHYLKQKDLSGE